MTPAERRDGDVVLRLRQDGLPWRVVEGEVIALDSTDSVYLNANRAGALLWQALAEGVTRAQLADQLVRAFGVALDRAERDVDAFLAELRTRGLLAGAGEDAP